MINQIIRIDNKLYYNLFNQIMYGEPQDFRILKTDIITINDFDFNLCKRMKKLTTHE
jgi:hypothetical protein